MTSTSSAAAPKAVAARDLLLEENGETPVGRAVGDPLDQYFIISAEPQDCSAALLFKGSPLRPAGSSDYAEAGYRIGTATYYAESADVYRDKVDVTEVITSGFTAVSGCTGPAVGVTETGSGRSNSMQLSQVSMPDDGVLAWTMTSPTWTCDYGMVVIPQAVLMISLCEPGAGFDMGAWASTRRDQLQAQNA